ncbi:MAG: FMN-binding glutamate synthase family protein [Firmicutes bacterium]|nr:FMN-binding glutamate synthase family protein [Bacillota bacterium]
MVLQWMTNIASGAMNEAADDLVFKMLKDKYTDNLLSVLSVAKRMSFFNIMELLMRATQGTALERPLGTHLHLSPWELLLLNPVHLYRLPVEDYLTIDTSVTIGPESENPLKLQIPVFIAGMSYGSALSRDAKVALARAATEMGTATNTGEAGLLTAEREAATRLIGQYNRGGYLNTPDKYTQLDAVEIQLGQGAQGSSPQRTAARFIDEEMRQVFEVGEGEDVVLHSRVPGIDGPADLRRVAGQLRRDTKVPIGVKMAASNFIEKELAIALDAGVDFVTVDGAEGASHATSPTSEDDLGLPTIYAIARARRFLESRGARGRVSLLAGGGLFTPGQFLKALALGADAVYIGTAAVMAMVAQQLVKASPREPSLQLVLHSGRLHEKFDVELAVKSLVNFLKASVDEMKNVMYSLGHAAVSELGPDDLCCVDPWLARALGVSYAGVAPEEQDAFFAGMQAGTGIGIGTGAHEAAIPGH